MQTAVAMNKDRPHAKTMTMHTIVTGWVQHFCSCVLWCHCLMASWCAVHLYSWQQWLAFRLCSKQMLHMCANHYGVPPVLATSPVRATIRETNGAKMSA